MVQWRSSKEEMNEGGVSGVTSAVKFLRIEQGVGDIWVRAITDLQLPL